jgi:hypothetical protein
MAGDPSMTQDFIELQVVVPEGTEDSIEVYTATGVLRYKNVIVLRVQDHPADNHGSITGVCQVCDEAVAHHRSYRDKDGNIVKIKTQEIQNGEV